MANVAALIAVENVMSIDETVALRGLGATAATELTERMATTVVVASATPGTPSMLPTLSLATL